MHAQVNTREARAHKMAEAVDRLHRQTALLVSGTAMADANARLPPDVTGGTAYARALAQTRAEVAETEAVVARGAHTFAATLDSEEGMAGALQAARDRVRGCGDTLDRLNALVAELKTQVEAA